MVNPFEWFLEQLNYTVFFLQKLTWQEMLLFFWPALCIDFPRFVLTDVFVFVYEFFLPKSFEASNFAKKLRGENAPLVSVILVGLNEAKAIEKCVRSLAENSYRNKEIIVIDDGSDDGMDVVCRSLVSKYGIKFYRHQQRTGKPAGTNHAFQFSRGEFILIGDTDTSFDRDAIYQALLPFADPQVGAVSANLRVRNYRKSWITWTQAIEYVLGIGIGRRFMAAFGLLSIVSGAFGVYRRKAWMQVGGSDIGPGEDADLTIKVRKAGYKVAFAPKAMCMTNAPETIVAFWKQRLRWSRSMVRLRIRKHSDLYHWNLFDPASTIAMADSVFFSVVLLMTRVVYYSVLFAWRGDLVLRIAMSTWIIYTCFSFIQWCVAMCVSERKRDDFLLLFFIPTFAGFTFLHAMVRFYSYIDEFFFFTSFRDRYIPRRVQSKREIIEKNLDVPAAIFKERT